MSLGNSSQQNLYKKILQDDFSEIFQGPCLTRTNLENRLTTRKLKAAVVRAGKGLISLITLIARLFF